MEVDAEMKARSLACYSNMIKAAKTKEELKKISYDAIKDDPECTVFSKKYNAIIKMCVKREMEMEK